MSSNQTNSPSSLLKKLAKVPLLCNVLEQQMHEETQDRQRSNAQQSFINSINSTSNNAYHLNDRYQQESQHRRHSMPSWQRSHTITHSNAPLLNTNVQANVYPPRNHVSRSSTETLHSEHKVMSVTNNRNSLSTDRVISHLDLESNHIKQAKDNAVNLNHQRHQSLGHSSSAGSSSPAIVNTVQRQFSREKDSHSSSRQASAPVYHPNKQKSEWEEEVFVGGNERRNDSKGKPGQKRRHYSEAIHGESSNKKIRRASGPDVVRSKPQQNLLSQETSRRSTSPHPVELPFSLDTLTEEVKEISKSNAQSADLLKKKETLRSVLENIFRQQFPGCSLHLVGSSVNGFGNQTSDADFCLMLTHWREIDQRLEARKILLQLERLMQFCHFVEKSNVIFATVPIIKFVDSVSKCECDININNHVGIRNTFLLKAYCEVDDRLCPLVMVIKKWAKTHGINDSKDGTLSSYALTLMTIHYLQYGCKPPVLPSLQSMFPDLFTDDGNVINLMKIDLQTFFQEKRIPKSKNTQSLGELLLGFFQYFANFSWNSNVISVRLGRIYSKELGILPKRKFIFIEEPFDSNNVAKTVYNSANFDKIKMKISLAANKLRVSPSLKSII